jgi:DNA-binding GntR family transcriptional regulator
VSVLSEIKRSSLRQEVLRSLRAAIVMGEIRSGEIYSAPALAARLGVSATPVREAMLDLVSEGTIEAVRNRGFRVVAVSQADLDQILELRLLIEVPLVGRLAGKLSESELATLERVVRLGVRAARAADLIGFFGYDSEFHLGLLGLSGNAQAVDVVGRLRNRIRHHRLTDAEAPGRLVESALTHPAILEAVRTGRRRAAEQAMRDHLLLGRAVMTG